MKEGCSNEQRVGDCLFLVQMPSTEISPISICFKMWVYISRVQGRKFSYKTLNVLSSAEEINSTMEMQVIVDFKRCIIFPFINACYLCSCLTKLGSIQLSKVMVVSVTTILKGVQQVTNWVAPNLAAHQLINHLEILYQW